MVFIILVLIVYLVLIVILIFGFDEIKTFQIINSAPKTKFSIVVPFRNEEQNLPFLLESLSNLNYPTSFFEVILVDDASDFKFQLSTFNFKITVIDNFRISNSPKKDAISAAVPIAANNWILTTDADCVVKYDWLLVLDQFIQQQNPEMVCGSVTYDCQNSFLHNFQQLDLASLQSATIGSFGIKKPFMCNGANFAYTKNIFEKLNGFEGNNKIASGDDIFLLQKAVNQFPDKVKYLKAFENIVVTKPVDSWKDLFYQRVRWASKTKYYNSTFGKFLGLVVFFGNLSWILGFGCWILSELFWVLAFLFLKFFIDFILIYKAQYFLKSKPKYIFLSSFLYPFYGVFIAIYSLFGKYEWKGRRFS